MSGNIRLVNAQIVNEGKISQGELFIRDGKIHKVDSTAGAEHGGKVEVYDIGGKLLLPGVIDDQVHFREPGLTHKADIYTESRAAVAGGITSFMEMPNTVPNTLTQELLEQKYRIGARQSLANFSFYMGASNSNIDELVKTDPSKVCGIKVFMGASTGNMLVDDPVALKNIFSRCDILIATHCEDEPTIQQNLARARDEYEDNVSTEIHPLIRSEEACFKSSAYAVELASMYKSRLHVLHLSTGRELELFDATRDLENKRITAEVCVHHLWFDENDYRKKGNLIKWNPAIKTSGDREALWEGLLNNKLDVVATDHAPHTLEEKQQGYFKAPSGGPLVQHSLVAMLEFYHKGRISLEQIVQKMCHNPAICFQVDKRGFIREGYWADLVVVDPSHPWKVETPGILYKCGWSPFEGEVFNSMVETTFVNGTPAYHKGKINEHYRGSRIMFNRKMS